MEQLNSSPQHVSLLSEDLDFSCFSEGFELFPIETPERFFLDPTLQKTSKKITKKLKPSDLSPQEIKSRATRNPWKPYEDQLLIELVQRVGPQWTLIGKLIGGRSCRQVRDRYLNKLRPNINHGPFTLEEDEELTALYYGLGAKWSMIGEKMKGRTESQVKNRFYMVLKYRISGKVVKEESVCSQSTGGSGKETMGSLAEL